MLWQTIRREGEREGEREGGREGGREGEREKGRESGREGGREGGREEREGGERGREGERNPLKTEWVDRHMHVTDHWWVWQIPWMISKLFRPAIQKLHIVKQLNTQTHADKSKPIICTISMQ